MIRNKEIIVRIQENFGNLPKNQRKVARYCLDNFDKVPFLNVRDISTATGSSVASVVRFAQSIGFSGYSELREAISGSLQNQLSSLRNITLFEKKKAEKDILNTVANLGIKNINDTLQSIDRESFDSAVDIILKARRVYTGGLGVSHITAEFLAYELAQVAIDAQACMNNSLPFTEQVPLLSSKDVLVLFSFPPYSKDTIELGKIASENKIPVIAITDKEVAPIVFFSKLHLIIHSENMLFTNSLTAISVLINGLATAIAMKNQSKTKALQKATSDILETYNKTVNY